MSRMRGWFLQVINEMQCERERRQLCHCLCTTFSVTCCEDLCQSQSSSTVFIPEKCTFPIPSLIMAQYLLTEDPQKMESSSSRAGGGEDAEVGCGLSSSFT